MNTGRSRRSHGRLFLAGTAVAIYRSVAIAAGARSQFAHQPRAVGARTEEAMNLINRMRALVTDDAGQDLLEYALLVGLIALVAVVAVTATGTSVKNVFADVATKIKVPAAP